jgi:dTDP-4-dehydrorhamnose reductase
LINNFKKKMAHILIIGGSGQLGTCLKAVADKKGIVDVVFEDRLQADILDLSGLSTLFDLEKPKFVINCAAYTAVDKAEDEQELARKINRDGAANLGKLCKLHGATLIHVSTDFVFDGSRPKLLSEDEPTSPINVYGLTKLEGEQAIAKHLSEFFILRTSWLYSEFANNFVKTMRKLGKEQDELKIIADQVGTPTYAIDLAHAIFTIIESQSTDYGVYHYSNEGVASWYDFGKAIFQLSNIDVSVIPIPTSEYITKASRPAFSVLDKGKIKRNFNIEIPYWRDSLELCIQQMED